MSAENIYNTIKRLVPDEGDRQDGNLLADRFDTIKPQLKRLGVSVHDFDIAGIDITTIELSFNKSKSDKVKSLLDKADIAIMQNPQDTFDRYLLLGLLAEGGATKKELKRVMDTQKICIYKGKYMNEEDLLRMVPKVI